MAFRRPKQALVTAQAPPRSGVGAIAITVLDLAPYGQRHAGYIHLAAAEDRATVGTDPSAAAGPYGTGGIQRGAARCVPAADLDPICPGRTPDPHDSQALLPTPSTTFGTLTRFYTHGARLFFA